MTGVDKAHKANLMGQGVKVSEDLFREGAETLTEDCTDRYPRLGRRLQEPVPRWMLWQRVSHQLWL